MSTALTTTTTVRELTKLCKTGRQAYLEAVQRRDEMEAAMIRADALLSAIEAAQTEQAAAALLRMAHPDAGMVEVVGEGSNRETVRVMAMALFCGFTPGRQEFAIFHGRVKSALYLKDAGIRKLLVQMGCEPPTANAGFPMQVQLKSGLTVWAVEGEASTVYDGKTYRVAFTGPGAVKLPCKFFKNSSDSSDNIDGIIAKARRRMLLELMRVVQSAAGMTPEDSNEGDDTTIDARLEVIDAGPVQQQSAPELDILSEVAALQTKLSPPHATLLGDAHADIVRATSEAQLRAVWEEVNRLAREAKLDKDTIKLLTRIKDARKQELTSEV
jgi:hypothetical protein